MFEGHFPGDPIFPGVMIIEAMAQAIPPVASDVGGTRELIVNGKSGYVVPINDPKAIADKIRKLHCDPELKRSMGKSAKKRILDNFSVQKSVTDHLCFFKQLLTNNSQSENT